MTLHDHATPFDLQLDRALRRAPLEPPPELADRVLRAAGSSPRPRRARSTAALLAAAILVMGAAMAFTPVRDTLGLGARELLAQYGRGATPQGIASASSNGTTLRILSAYDDGDRVVLAVHSDTGGAVFLNRYTLVDANGRPLARGGVGPVARGAYFVGPTGAGDNVVVARRPAGSAGAGSELTLRVTRLWVFDRAPERVVTGDWVLRFRVPPAQAPRSLAVPVPASAGGATLTCTSVRATPRYVTVGLQVAGTVRGAADLDVALVDPRGDTSPLLDSSGMPTALAKGGPVRYYAPDGQPVADPNNAMSAAEEWTWALRGPGTYRLVITSRSDPTVRVEREIAVHP